MAVPKRPLRGERRNDDPTPKSGEDARKPLRLIRTEVEPNGIRMIFDADGYEASWLLEQTSMLEFFALVLGGQMRDGQRVIVPGDITLEPPAADLKRPMVCFSGSPLQTCVPVSRDDLRGLRDEIDHVLSLTR